MVARRGIFLAEFKNHKIHFKTLTIKKLGKNVAFYKFKKKQAEENYWKVVKKNSENFFIKKKLLKKKYNWAARHKIMVARRGIFLAEFKNHKIHFKALTIKKLWKKVAFYKFKKKSGREKLLKSWYKMLKKLFIKKK